jgi:type I restriction enzyme, R subunit
VFLTPYYHLSGQVAALLPGDAINLSVLCILHWKRVLLTLATVTGKNIGPFRSGGSLTNSIWSRTDEHRRPRILYLADRNTPVTGIIFDSGTTFRQLHIEKPRSRLNI